MISFKKYLIAKKKDIILWGVIYTIAFGIFTIISVFDSDSLLYGGMWFITVIYVLFVLLVDFLLKSNYKKFLKAHERFQIKLQEKQNFYDHMTFCSFINMLYEDNLIDLNIAGCPKEYDDDQAKQWLKDYIKRLVEEDNNDI